MVWYSPGSLCTAICSSFCGIPILPTVTRCRQPPTEAVRWRPAGQCRRRFHTVRPPGQQSNPRFRWHRARSVGLSHEDADVYSSQLFSNFRKLCRPFHWNLGYSAFLREISIYSRFRFSSSRNSLYSTLSTSASHEASMRFSETPTVPHVFSPSLDSISTRVFAAVASSGSRIRTE